MSRDPHSASSRVLDLMCVIVLGLLLAFLAGAVARATPAAARGQEAAHGAQRSIHPLHAAGTNAADCATAAQPDAPTVAGGPSMRGGLPASMSLAPCADGGAPAPATAAAATDGPAATPAPGAAGTADPRATAASAPHATAAPGAAPAPSAASPHP